jgi:hypothetical protein
MNSFQISLRFVQESTHLLDLDDSHQQIAPPHEISLGEMPMGWLFGAVEQGMHWVGTLEEMWSI